MLPTQHQPTATFLRDAYAGIPGIECGEGSYGLLTIFRWTGSLKVGRYCSFAMGTIALLGGEHRPDWVTTYPFSGLWPEAKDIVGHSPPGDIEVGNDVWVAAQALILGGAKIGNGAVIAARTVVSGTVAPYSVVGGNPMRFLRWRFPQDVREALLEIAWWDWPRERIVRALPVLLQDEPRLFITRVRQGEL